MIYRKIPKFIMKRYRQKSLTTFDQLVTENVMRQICVEVTGQSHFEYEFVENSYSDEFLDATYNQGRLAILQYHNTAAYISFSDEYCVSDSGIIHIPVAMHRFYTNEHNDKEMYFYFLPCEGENDTSYYLYIYRLMRTAGVRFLNVPDSLAGQITAFTSIDEIIRARTKEVDWDYNAAYDTVNIIKYSQRRYDVFGKTSDYRRCETCLTCYAISALKQPDADIRLYLIDGRDEITLPDDALWIKVEYHGD